MRRARATWQVLAIVGVLAAVAAPPGALADDPIARPGVGAPGVGDAYFPRAGNGGYDVQHYDLSIRYDPMTRALTGRAVIDAIATQRLHRFNLDLVRSMAVKSIEVDGDPAIPEQVQRELRVSPAADLRPREPFRVDVSYAGTTKRPHDVNGFLFGWVSTSDGAYVANECDGAPTWFPGNDHPTDKATYDLHITVPDGKTAVSNGDLVGTRTTGGWTTWDWHAPDPMTTYVVTATIGDFDLIESEGPHGLPILDAIDRDLPDTADHGIDRQADMIAFFEGVFGTYPFTSAGAVIDDTHKIGYALETQTRAIYPDPPGEVVVAHEIAHQWFGNAVTLSRWRDIWLNEGFATFAQWLWVEEDGGPTPADQFDRLYERPPTHKIWRLPPGDPGPSRMFNDSVYVRGAMTLQALREKIGDEDFFTMLRTWFRDHEDSDASTSDLIDLAEDVSGQQLDSFFDIWLYAPEKPVDW